MCGTVEYTTTHVKVLQTKSDRRDWGEEKGEGVGVWCDLTSFTNSIPIHVLLGVFDRVRVAFDKWRKGEQWF